MRNTGVHILQPPSKSIFKLNFDATIFSKLNNFGVGAIICNEKGEMVASTLAKGPLVGEIVKRQKL